MPMTFCSWLFGRLLYDFTYESKRDFLLENNFKNNKGVLEIEGVSIEKLAQKYKTPLYIWSKTFKR